MKKIILSIVGVLAVLWVALFVADARILVKEVSPSEHDRLCTEAKTRFDELWWCGSKGKWGCTYFNGRSLVNKYFLAKYDDACPTILFGTKN